MTTDTVLARAPRVGARRFERYLTVLVAVFGLLYALQTLDAFVADWPSMSGPLGGAAVALVAGAVLLGTVAAAVVPVRARALFLGASLLFCGAVAIWPLAITATIPGTPMPWFIGLLPVVAAYLAVAVRGVVLPVWCTVLLSVGIACTLVVRGGLSVPDAVANGLFGVVMSVALVSLIAAVRRGVARADTAQHTALSRYAQSRLDDATEAERARTDALVHDSVLTTFLSAAAAHEPEAEALTRRMATNALRVLAHVNRSADTGPVVPLGKAIGDRADRFAPLRAEFEMEIGPLADLVVPVDAVEALADSLFLVMESALAATPAGTARSVRMSELGPDGVRIVIADDAPGFDPTDAVSPRARALRQVALRMRAVDGRATVETTPDGTVVRLSWGSVVVSGVTPRDEPIAAPAAAPVPPREEPIADAEVPA
jgi:signal transduction histidine kinase